nr:lysosomal Pro-X carboxypeptidase-like isoform X1 [Ipomoea trifida]
MPLSPYSLLHNFPFPNPTPVHHNIPHLTSFHRPWRLSSSVSDTDDDVTTYYYNNQTLDHFTYAPQSYANFSQRYMVSSKYWGGAQNNSPIDNDPTNVYFSLILPIVLVLFLSA